MESGSSSCSFSHLGGLRSSNARDQKCQQHAGSVRQQGLPGNQVFAAGRGTPIHPQVGAPKGRFLAVLTAQVHSNPDLPGHAGTHSGTYR